MWHVNLGAPLPVGVRQRKSRCACNARHVNLGAPSRIHRKSRCASFETNVILGAGTVNLGAHQCWRHVNLGALVFSTSFTVRFKAWNVILGAQKPSNSTPTYVNLGALLSSERSVSPVAAMAYSRFSALGNFVEKTVDKLWESHVFHVIPSAQPPSLTLCVFYHLEYPQRHLRCAGT